MQGNATLQRIWHGMGNDRALWCEGPVWMGDWGSLIWSDIPNHRTLRWIEDDGHVSVFQTESGYSNGHTRDNQGRLIVGAARQINGVAVVAGRVDSSCTATVPPPSVRSGSMPTQST
jgi:sugar lactone lactonase YvrE